MGSSIDNNRLEKDNIEKQLDLSAKRFINDTSRNVVSQNKLQLSKIFKWFKGDFTKNGSLQEFIQKYANKKVDPKAKVKYLDYNWKLNNSSDE